MIRDLCCMGWIGMVDDNDYEEPRLTLDEIYDYSKRIQRGGPLS